jgi:hypothetical protein
MFLRLRSIAILAVTLFVLSSLLCSQTVISRKRVGNIAEGTTYVSTGPLAGSIAMVDGFDVFTFPANNPRAPVTKAFNLWDLALADHPRGIAYIPKEKRFVYTQDGSPNVLFFSDSKGHASGTLTFQYLNGYAPTNWIEGVTYIPPDANSLYPNHFVIAANTNTGTTFDRRLEVVGRDGVSALQIILDDLNTSPPGSPGNGLACAGIQYVPARDTILCGLTADGNYLVEYTFAGTVASYTDNTHPIYANGYLEGVTLLPNGKVALVGVETGKVTFLNPDLTRAPELDRSFPFPPEILLVSSMAWNSDTKNYIMSMSYPPGNLVMDPSVWTFNRSFRTYSKLISIDPAEWGRHGQMVYLSDEHKLAILYRDRATPDHPVAHPDILLYDGSGTLLETLHLDNILPYNARSFVPPPLTYIPGPAPGTGKFLVAKSDPDGTPTPYAWLISRAGEHVGTLDLTNAGMSNGFGSVTYFDKNRLLFQLRTDRMIITDLNGAYVREFSPWSTMHLEGIGRSPTAFINNGPDAPAFGTFSAGEFIVWKKK